MKIIKIGLLIFCIIIIHNISYAQNPGDYLILQNIGSYSSDGKGKCGNGSGILGGADHFGEDHNVLTCETDYYNFQQKMAVEIKVEQHTGGDSDRWLLHEADKSFRTSLGIPGDAYWQRKINGQSILESGAGGRTYRWLSGNKVINIEYTDAQLTKPEPLEIVQSYLAKHPSTIMPFTLQELRNSANVTKWIKDEIDRRLWLCDKRTAQFQAGQATQKDLLYNLNRSLGVFLNYRQKYYGVEAKDDLIAIRIYMSKNDLTSMLNKLTEYKTWWNANKGKGITLP